MPCPSRTKNAVASPPDLWKVLSSSAEPYFRRVADRNVFCCYVATAQNVLHESNLPNFAQPLDDSWSGVPAGKDDHATEVIGRTYAWPLFARILLATAGCRRPLLPGLLALCRRIQVRLEDHAPRRAHGPYRT